MTQTVAVQLHDLKFVMAGEERYSNNLQFCEYGSSRTDFIAAALKLMVNKICIFVIYLL